MGLDLTGLAEGYARVVLPDGSTVDVKMADTIRSTTVIYQVVMDEQIMTPELAVTLMTTHRNYWRGAAEHYEKEADRYRTAYADAMEKLRRAGLVNGPTKEGEPPLRLIGDGETPE